MGDGAVTDRVPMDGVMVQSGLLSWPIGEWVLTLIRDQWVRERQERRYNIRISMDIEHTG